MFLRTFATGALAALLAGASAARCESVGAGQAARSETVAWPGSSLILFGARWCAPCVAELRELDPLAIAAHPQRLVLAWIDHPVHLSTPAQRVETLQPDVAQHLAERSAGRGFGLPLAVMTDAVGRPCALRRARVHPADVAAMRARCGSVP